MKVKRILFLFLVIFGGFGLKAQYIYYKSMPEDSLILFKDSVSKLQFIYKDTSYKKDYTLHFNYVMRFFTKIEYNKIKVIFKKSKRVTHVKPSFWCFFQAPENRTYKVIFSTKSNPTLDSVLLHNLHFNSQLGMIASEMGNVKELSTDGFFNLVGWHFRQLSRRSRKKIDHDNDMKVLEIGCGYLLLALSMEEEVKLHIDRWHNARAYAHYFRHYQNHFMSAEAIKGYIKDMPVYVTHKYR
ncbi:MAG: hypothetical protein IPM51_00645 [Sphingobacteriaceae bacterium]|nr:hypothetical protein [Sphingobacteriaceae bacterium]